MAIKAASAEEAATAVGNFLGLPPLARADLGHLAIAATIVAIIALVGRLTARRLCAWFDRSLAPKLGLSDRFPLISVRLAGAVVALAAIALLRIAAAGYAWPDYSDLLFDVAIAVAVAIAASRLAYAFNASRIIAVAAAFVCGFWVLTERYEQLGWVQGSLDGFAVTLGKTRISLLDLASFSFAGIVLYAVALVANRGVKAIIQRRPNLDVTQSLLAEKVASIGIAVVTIFLAIDLLGIDTTAFSIFSGTIGLGLGFGLQKIFSNLVSGLILLMDRSIKPGDVIVVGEAVGKVNRIGTRAVSIITRDGKEYLIPNEVLMTERVENWSFSSRKVRIRMSVRVDYDSDLDLVERLLKDAVRDSPRVLDSPEAVVWIIDLGDAGIKHELRFWIRDPEDGLGNIQGEIYRRIIAKFREHEIVMPNPAREIEITRLPPVALKGPGG